ncbi:MAG: hypothetical protein ACOX8V_03750 [Thermoleophilia bacterium]|jgi:hypothetical protein
MPRFEISLSFPALDSEALKALHDEADRIFRSAEDEAGLDVYYSDEGGADPGDCLYWLILECLYEYLPDDIDIDYGYFEDDE